MNGAVIFLHGEEQTAAQYRNSISGLVGLEQMLIENGFMPLFPDAELQKEPPSDEYRALWFVNDEGQSGLDITEADWSIRRAYGKIISPAIDRMKVKYSVPVHKVIVGGFSRGGDMGLQMLRLNPDIGGFFSVAGYLPDNSAVYAAVQSAPKEQPVFMSHGSLDDVVPVDWGQTTFDKLEANGANVEFTLRDIGHWQDEITLIKLQDWIVKTYEEIWKAER
jgi:predicted esterase